MFSIIHIIHISNRLIEAGIFHIFFLLTSKTPTLLWQAFPFLCAHKLLMRFGCWCCGSIALWFSLVQHHAICRCFAVLMFSKFFFLILFLFFILLLNFICILLIIYNFHAEYREVLKALLFYIHIDNSIAEAVIESLI